MEMVSYSQVFLPDLLWIAAMFDAPRKWTAAYEALDVIDRFVPYDEMDGKSIVDGRISSFSLVPESSRKAAAAALGEETPWALPDALGHALLLYPECPAGWLYELWRDGNRIDPEAGLVYMKYLLRQYGDRESVESTRLRMVPLNRLLKHQKLHFMDTVETAKLLPEYPDGLSEDERRRVEAMTRAAYNGFIGRSLASDPERASWARHFWNHNWSISPCELEPPMPQYEMAEVVESDASSDQEAAQPVGDLQAELSLIFRHLGAKLRDAQLRVPLNLTDATKDEVKLGLTSRLFRLVCLLFMHPTLWDWMIVPHLLRPMVDTRITLAWLLQRDDRELFERYREFGLGRQKLFKLHVEDYVAEHETEEEHADVLDALQAAVNDEIMEEFRKIDLGGNFAGVSLRQMAIDTELKSLYDLNYQQLSAEAHGEWTSLTGYDLRRCVNPLHGFHRIGLFMPRELDLSLDLLPFALQLAADGITEAFDSFGVDVTDPFAEAAEACAAAMQGG